MQNRGTSGTEKLESGTRKPEWYARKSELRKRCVSKERGARYRLSEYY